MLAFAYAAPVLSGCGSAGGGGNHQNGAVPRLAAAPAAPSAPIAAGLALPPAGSIYLGAYVDTTGLTHGANPQDVADLESQLGRKLAIEDGYLPFSSKFGTRNQLDDYANGRLPIYSWNCGPPNVAIAAGAYDASIQLQADSIKSYGWPVFVRYQWDPDLPATSLNRGSCYDSATDGADATFSASEYVAAWNHIHAIFAREGAINAIFLWTISSVGKNSASYYPGDATVDWVGMDAYDLSDTTFSGTFAAEYAILAPFGKPLMISETGASAESQVDFFANGATTLQTQFPLVRAFVYYDAIGVQSDWRVVPDASSAFEHFATQPYVGARYVRP